MKKAFSTCGMFLVAVLLAVSVQADDLMDFSYLVRDVVDSNPGNEMISPVFRFSDRTGDGVNDRISVNFQVYDVGTNSMLFQTPAKLFTFPADGCADPVWMGREVTRTAFRGRIYRGHILLVMQTSCTERTAPEVIVETYRTYIYSTDVRSRNNAGTWVRMWNVEAVGWNSVDWDGDAGNDEFMVTLEVPRNNGTSRKVVMLNPVTGEVETDNTYAMVIQQ